MNYIKNLTIQGLKKFENFYIEFDKNVNIIIGENESGKSTILEAINICINQLYKNIDKSIIKDLLNINNVKKFKENPSIESLPKIEIEIEFNLDNDSKNNFLFYGMHNNDEREKYGIKYICELNKEFEQDVFEFIQEKKIPYEYYEMKWTTFQGSSFNILKQPLNYLTIDNSITTQYNTYNYYNKSVFKSRYNGTKMIKAKNDFRISIEDIFSNLNLEKISETQKFGIDTKKVILENIISILDNDVLLENKGKGMENLLKTQIALDRAKSKLDVVSIEEPENHLSYINLRKMLKNIENYKEDKQIIITTHSSLIVSGLNINNIIWVNKNESKKLKDVDKDIAEFFIKSDNNNLLQFLLAKRVILVEGATEYILVPKIFKEMFNETVEENEIDIISCNGVKYKNFIHIAELMDKKICVITDNDNSQEKINEINSYNKQHCNIKIFTDNNILNWTWEICFYNLNSNKLNDLIDVKENAKYLYKEKDYGQILGKMLNNKAEIAYKICMSNEKFKYPLYVKEALKWIKG